jgi:hypothetical protein
METRYQVGGYTASFLLTPQRGRAWCSRLRSRLRQLNCCSRFVPSRGNQDRLGRNVARAVWAGPSKLSVCHSSGTIEVALMAQAFVST